MQKKILIFHKKKPIFLSKKKFLLKNSYFSIQKKNSHFFIQNKLIFFHYSTHRVEEMRQSIRIIEQCMNQMPPGEVRVKLFIQQKQLKTIHIESYLKI